MTGKVPRTIAGLVLLVVVALATVAARIPHAREWAERSVAAAGLVSSSHWLAFCAGQVLVAICAVLPASLMAVAAGAAYGTVDGFLISAACTMLGGWIGFLLSRSMLRPWIARWIGKYGASARFDDAIAQEGWRFVCLLRISPLMPFAATSYGLGLTRIGQRAYLLGTLASLPALAGYVAIGAFGREGVTLGLAQAGPVQWIVPVLGVVAILVAAARVKRLINRVARPLPAEPGRVVEPVSGR